MSDKSFVRFGGLAGILLAITSWLSVIEYYALVPSAQQLPVADASAYLASLAQNAGGTLLFNGLYALIAFWALFAIVAVYYRIRSANEGWALFATLIGEIASVGTVAASFYQVANLKFIASAFTASPAAALAALGAPSPINPFGIMTFGLTALWFLIAAWLMLRTDLPKLLGYLGLIAFADLTLGFVASVAGIPLLSTLAAVIAGAVGGPIFWLWLGVLLRREA
ncbi:MAG: DUF4386 family protein [Chloroflexota bacterium]|nr:DUF4386 family protein [Chloroflexota bacterium]